jgi:hypothetical protein
LTGKFIEIKKTIIILYSSLKSEADNPEILIIRQLFKVPSIKFSGWITGYPNHVSPPLTSSATKTSGPKSPGPSSLVETEETSTNKRWDPNAPEATAEGYLQMQCSD